MKVLKDNLAGAEEEDPTFVDDSHMYYKGDKIYFSLSLILLWFCSIGIIIILEIRSILIRTS